MVAAPADEGDHGDALYASSTPRSCLPCLQIATPATKRGEVRSAGGRPRRWRRRRTALFRLPGQRQRPSSESRASERAAKAAAAILSMAWYGVACTKLPGRVLAPIKPLGRARDGRQQRLTDRADAFAPCGTPSDLVDGRGELYERCGRRTWHAASIQALWLCPMASAHASSSCAAADVARALLLLSSAWRAVEILRPRLRQHAGRFVK